MNKKEELIRNLYVEKVYGEGNWVMLRDKRYRNLRYRIRRSRFAREISPGKWEWEREWVAEKSTVDGVWTQCPGKFNALCIAAFPDWVLS